MGLSGKMVDLIWLDSLDEVSKSEPIQKVTITQEH
jgi:hypothetical protein